MSLGNEDYSYLRYYYEWEGIKESVAKQFKKEGIKEGKEIGIKKGEENIMINAIREGFDNQTIQKLTGFKIEEINKIRKELKENQ